MSTSFLAGIDHVSTDLELADDSFLDEPLPFEEAVDFFKSRVSVSAGEWRKLEPQLRFRAFTVSALSGPDTIDRVRNRMVSLLEKGSTLDQFWNQEKIEGLAGLEPKNPFYWETVYRTNMQTAYNAGRAMEFDRTKPEYLEFIGIEDERQTDICSKRSGIILPSSHPFWKSNYPPLHFNCRSTVRALFAEEVDQLRQENPNWKMTDESNLPGTKDLKGFGENPYQASSFYKLTPNMVERIIATGNQDKVTDLALKLGLVSDPLETSRLIQQARIVQAQNLRGDSYVKAIEDAQQNLVNNLKGTSALAPVLNEEIQFTRSGLEKAINFSGDPKKASVLSRLPEVIRNTEFNPVALPPTDPSKYSASYLGRVVFKTDGAPQQYQVRVNRRKDDGKLEFKDLAAYVLGWSPGKRKPPR